MVLKNVPSNMFRESLSLTLLLHDSVQHNWAIVNIIIFSSCAFWFEFAKHHVMIARFCDASIGEKNDYFIAIVP